MFNVTVFLARINKNMSDLGQIERTQKPAFSYYPLKGSEEGVSVLFPTVEVHTVMSE